MIKILNTFTLFLLYWIAKYLSHPTSYSSTIFNKIIVEPEVAIHF